MQKSEFMLKKSFQVIDSISDIWESPETVEY